MQGKLFGNQTGGPGFNYVLIGLAIGLLAAGGTANLGTAFSAGISDAAGGDW